MGTAEAGSMSNSTSDPSATKIINWTRFNERLQGLPRELYDEIVNYTFTATLSKCRMAVTSKRKFVPKSHREALKLLCISRDTREQFAASYYSQTTFIFLTRQKPADMNQPCNRPAVIYWLKTIPDHHRDHVGQIKMNCISLDKQDPFWPMRNSTWREGMRKYVGNVVDQFVFESS